MRKRIGFLLLALLIFFPIRVMAQADAPLAIVAVDLWPEFDRPTTLVIYHITLSSQVALPYEMTLRIPAVAGAPHAVAVKQPDGALISIPYQQTLAAGWTQVTFRATTPDIQFEYYDPALIKDGAARTYTFSWPGDYAAQNFNIEVQRPFDASEMKIKPGMVNIRQGQDNLTYYAMEVGPLNQGQVFAITIEYQKSSDELSISRMPVQPSAPLDGDTPGAASYAFWLPWFLGAVGLLLIGGGAVWYWQSGRQKQRPKRASHGRRATDTPVALTNTGDEGQVHCHQCGKRALPGDRFCRACGTALRIN